MSENKVTVGAVAKIKNRVKRLGTDEGGFTLVEMVVALTVVLLMAGAALITAPGFIRDSNHAKCDSVADSLANAIVASYAHYGDYSKATFTDMQTDQYLVATPDDFTLAASSPVGKGVKVDWSAGQCATTGLQPDTWGPDAQTTSTYIYGSMT